MRLIYWETDFFMEKSAKLSLKYQEIPGPKVIKHFSCSTQLSMKLKLIMFYGPEKDRLRILFCQFLKSAEINRRKLVSKDKITKKLIYSIYKKGFYTGFSGKDIVSQYKIIKK